MSEIEIKDIFDLIECEIGCIRGGNTLTPKEQDIAIETCKNIKDRIRGELEATLKKGGD